MTAKFPYARSFIASLQTAGKQASTIEQYELTLADFFNYEQHFNETFAKDQLLADLTENDIRAYLEMLREQRQFKPSTLNKALSNLNGYFSYLFAHRIITTLPTFAIKGQPLLNQPTTTTWPELLPQWLANEDLHPYTRLFLLLTYKGYTATEMLTPGFYQDFKQLQFTVDEHRFIMTLQTYLQPLQAQSGSPDLFLKKRQRGNDPHITLAALHKYLAGDGQRLGVPLKPVTLRQDFILWYLNQHRTTEPTQIMTRLRLDATSLEYYQNLLRQRDLRTLQAKNVFGYFDIRFDFS
ncbi:integrase [Lactiplantibacillus pentosus]|uniref:phage integrase N-terminal SAM-like domain-containing protein n=1 Tax=Lactiplantibacillus pentosus TaxID=1589 RepID=UPI0021A5B808|nr:phage integrase N-terminal SAM-like domain-containing protein [Lactiplantibacillus pentosus]MCT3284197.1 integrase [Lactiplantibacillus pentosus]